MKSIFFRSLLFFFIFCFIRCSFGDSNVAQLFREVLPQRFDQPAEIRAWENHDEMIDVLTKMPRRLFQKSGPGPDGDRYFEFIPLWMASLYPGGWANWSSPCFLDNSAQVTVSEVGFVVDLKTGSLRQPSSSPVFFEGKAAEPLHRSACSDLYLIATRQSWFLRRINQSSNSEYENLVASEGWLPTEYDYVQQYGVQVFLIQGGVVGFIEDLVKTALFLFSAQEEQDSIQFLQDYVGWTLEPRNLSVTTIIPSVTEVQSGDYLAFFKFGPPNGGWNSMEAYGTGGHCDHAAVILEIDGEKYVTESIGGGGNYPGGPQGIIATPYAAWMENLRVNHTAWLVNLLRLSKSSQSRWNQQAAEQFFKSVQGNPYGFNNYIFGWIDTVNANYPPPLSAPLLPILFTLMDKIDYNASWMMWGQALNHRVNNTGPYLDMNGIFELIEPQNISFYDLMTVPEQDSWRYGPEQLPSLVCDVYVMAVYNAAGIFDPQLDFSYTEMTPFDSYSLNLYAGLGEWRQPVGCANDQLYCQISGKYYLTMPGVNQVAPYSSMFNTCPGLPQEYYRPPGC